jgi:hypothetical protein
MQPHDLAAQSGHSKGGLQPTRCQPWQIHREQIAVSTWARNKPLMSKALDHSWSARRRPGIGLPH